MADEFVTPVFTQVKEKGGRSVALVEPYSYRDINVPAGFYWDGASVPRILWSVGGLSPGQYLGASCVHDYCYARADDDIASRKEADQYYYELLLRDGARRVQAYLAWCCVRSCGWPLWRRRV